MSMHSSNLSNKCKKITIKLNIYKRRIYRRYLINRCVELNGKLDLFDIYFAYDLLDIVKHDKEKKQINILLANMYLPNKYCDMNTVITEIDRIPKISNAQMRDPINVNRSLRYTTMKIYKYNELKFYTSSSLSMTCPLGSWIKGYLRKAIYKIVFYKVFTCLFRQYRMVNILEAIKNTLELFKKLYIVNNIIVKEGRLFNLPCLFIGSNELMSPITINLEWQEYRRRDDPCSYRIYLDPIKVPYIYSIIENKLISDGNIDNVCGCNQSCIHRCSADDIKDTLMHLDEVMAYLILWASSKIDHGGGYRFRFIPLTAKYGEICKNKQRKEHRKPLTKDVYVEIGVRSDIYDLRKYVGCFLYLLDLYVSQFVRRVIRS